jgi:hypothetical protein
MFEFFTQARKKRLSFVQLQTMQRVAQQVVLALEGSVRNPWPNVHGRPRPADDDQGISP